MTLDFWIIEARGTPLWGPVDRVAVWGFAPNSTNFRFIIYLAFIWHLSGIFLVIFKILGTPFFVEPQQRKGKQEKRWEDYLARMGSVVW